MQVLKINRKRKGDKVNNPKFRVIVATTTMPVMTFGGCGDLKKDSSAQSSSKAQPESTSPS